MPSWCSRGIRLNNTCCSASCGRCGGEGCSLLPGGIRRCCRNAIAKFRGPCRHADEVACTIPIGTAPIQAHATNTLPRCEDGSAYASLLVHHPNEATSVPNTKHSTFLSKVGAHGVSTPALLRQRMRRTLQLLVVLSRSLRKVEDHCRRDFILLLGTHVALPEAAHALLKRESIQLVSVDPVVSGIPSADKLHAWRLLTNYSRVLVVDTDVLILRSIDDLFRPDAPEFQIAHHPTEFMQARCSLPLARRGVGGFFVMKPDASRFEPLLKDLKTYNSYHLQHYSEQTMLSCHFANVSQTLPCSFCYDLANPAAGTCKGAFWEGDATRCLERFVGDCDKWSLKNMRKSCSIRRGARAARKCDAFAGPMACHAAREHVKSACTWTRALAMQVRAVHFKGSIKPWLGRATQGNYCNDVRSGAMRLAPAAVDMVDVGDSLMWDASTKNCKSNQTGRAVHWAPSPMNGAWVQVRWWIFSAARRSR